MRNGNKPKTNAWYVVAKDMRPHIRREKKRVNRSWFTEVIHPIGWRRPEDTSIYNMSKLCSSGNYVPFDDTLYNKESRALNRLLGLDTTEGINKWYK